MAKKNAEVDAAVYLQNSAKTLATNIRFASVDKPISTLVVTSSIPNEGKSTIAISLSEALASGGKNVLLIESDMRRRSLANMLGIHVRNGIYSVLSGQVPLNQAVVQTSMRGVYFLDSEPHIPNPVDILSSKRFQNFMTSCAIRTTMSWSTRRRCPPSSTLPSSAPSPMAWCSSCAATS